jgi:hypothetical protein
MGGCVMGCHLLRVVTYERTWHGCQTTTGHFQPLKNQTMSQRDYDNSLYTCRFNLYRSLSVSLVRDNPQYQWFFRVITQRMMPHEMELRAVVGREFEDHD